jgi:hypothetical protein
MPENHKEVTIKKTGILEKPEFMIKSSTTLKYEYPENNQ